MSDINQSENNPPSATRKPWFKRVGPAVIYWFSLILQPLLAVLFVIGLAYLFGYAQRNLNWFNDAPTSAGNVEAEQDSLYACSMLCVFVKAPGRCPVCGMELQQIDVPGDPKDIFGVTIDPTARRLANIKTVAALRQPMASQIEVLGKINYDETSEATISSYIDGRIDELLVDYTGATVEQGEQLALIYSPELYADQVGLLSAKKAMQGSRSNQERVKNANERLYVSARRRLIELGLTEAQIDAIEQRNKPDSRVPVFSPKSGTVVEKLIDEGKYVKAGMPILKLADLSQVWLMLQMFPKDTSALAIGQSVTVLLPSQPGKKFEGQISFIAPIVDERTQTVDVRIVIPNEAGLIKIGDLATAKIQTSSDLEQQRVVVPRDAVLMNGEDSVAYVETKPGRFEFRKVKIAEITGDQVAISSGIEPGELVAASGVFMLDSTFNIQGKVSLIDPERAELRNESQVVTTEAEAREIEESFAALSTGDRALAEQQVICPVTEVKLGTMGMGTPIRVELKERDVMICCEGCRTNLVKEPNKYFEILDKYQPGNDQTKSAAANNPESAPNNTIQRDVPSMDLPKMDLPKLDLPQMDLPKLDLPQMEVPK